LGIDGHGRLEPSLIGIGQFAAALTAKPRDALLDVSAPGILTDSERPTASGPGGRRGLGFHPAGHEQAPRAPRHGRENLAQDVEKPEEKRRHANDHEQQDEQNVAVHGRAPDRS